MEHMISCILCGKVVQEADAEYIGNESGKPEPYCEKCAGIMTTLEQLVKLKNELGIEAVTIAEDEDGIFIIDWNGEVEEYDTAEEAATALRQAS